MQLPLFCPLCSTDLMAGCSFIYDLPNVIVISNCRWCRCRLYTCCIYTWRQSVCWYLCLPWLAAETRWGLREYRTQSEVRLRSPRPETECCPSVPRWLSGCEVSSGPRKNFEQYSERKWKFNCDCEWDVTCVWKSYFYWYFFEQWLSLVACFFISTTVTIAVTF